MNTHNDNGPAIIYYCGTKMWYKHNALHRLDGPAIEFNDLVSYYIDGLLLTKEEWQTKVAELNKVNGLLSSINIFNRELEHKRAEAQNKLTIRKRLK